MNEEILNKYIELIDKGYCEDCNELNCLGNFPHKEIAKNIKLILEENKKYKEVINELRDYFEKTTKERLILSQCLEKLEELEVEDK